jgi:hypothetical protein
LRGKYGEVAPLGRSTLLAECDDPRIANRLAALGSAVLYLRGTSFWGYVIDPDDLDEAAGVLRVPRVRHLSPAAAARLAEVGQGTRFEGAVPRHSIA